MMTAPTRDRLTNVAVSLALAALAWCVVAMVALAAYLLYETAP
jgi:hypothetical protein